MAKAAGRELLGWLRRLSWKFSLVLRGAENAEEISLLFCLLFIILGELRGHFVVRPKLVWCRGA
jgi:hypothetical protein